MNRKLWSGLTAALILTTLGVSPSSQAGQSRITDEDAETDVPLGEAPPAPSTADPFSAETSISSSLSNTESDSENARAETVKVGEYQSQEDQGVENESIATIYSHEMDGQQAATLYVRDIPVLTFLGSVNADGSISPRSESSQTSTAHRPRETSLQASQVEEEKIASTQGGSGGSVSPEAISVLSEHGATLTSPDEDYSSDPVWRATSVAARLNQLYRDNLEAESVTVRWDADRERYVIQADDSDLVEISAQTVLPDTTDNLAEDALQATNRLRRQLGDAQPLTQIEGAPQPRAQRVSVGPIQFSFSGMASWYGPGFNGRRSASGEIFNQNALTAAHRNLPFGTLVEVTNVNNGRSVVVRINDRGPYSGRRVIDLSAAAARAIGMIQTGVAPVRINVLGSSNTATN